MRFSTLALATLLTACGAEPDDPGTIPEGATFDDAHAVFQAKCGSCHVTDGSGGHNIGADDADDAYDDSQLASTGGTVGDFALARILEGSMPQGMGCSGDPAADAGNAACLTEAELTVVEEWIDAGQPR